MKYKIETAGRELFYSRNDPKDRRLGELVARANIDDITPGSVAIIGVPEDRGITANKGRAGAAEGPDDIRRRLYRLTPGFSADFQRLRIIDVGNVAVKGLSLAEVHEAESEAVAEIVSCGALPIVLGGGHDLTYPGLEGLVRGADIGRGGMGLINVDAHLDVRSDENGINSGTSFYRALTQLPNGALSGGAFVEFGIQEQYNSPYYYNWVLEQGGHVITLREVSERVMEFFLQALNAAGKNGRAVAVSLDIDAVRSTEAPGASASNPSGLKAPELDKIAYLAGRSVKVKYLDVMEVSPILDEDHRTAALAASALFSFFRGLCER
ncbi:MAG: formimidoylglutamase [Synergistaceae bacterium]|nr:formimidoylglutamase [Synergistaceae bacterium]